MNEPHPSVDIIGTKGSTLQGKRIILAVSGSVAAVQASDIARHLMRHGAEVISVLSDAAQEIIHPHLMEWATGHKAITQLTGAIEHVALAGNVPRPADLLLVAPATANTLGKMACGIDDTPVTTFFTTAFGEGLPIVVVPAMHQAMYNHPFVLENIDKLRNSGVDILMPRVEEGKAKIATKEDILQAVEARLSLEPTLQGKKVLITSGRTVEYIDPVRVITNNSTGKMGVALAKAALQRGAEVTMVYGHGTVEPPPKAHVIRVDTASEMHQRVYEKLKEGFDMVIAAAAVGDWQLEEPFPEKITTHGTPKIQLTLVPTPKIIDAIKKQYPETVLVAFRAQTKGSVEALLADAKNRREKAEADFIAVNDVGKQGRGFGSDTNELYLLDQKGGMEVISLDTKDKVAGNLLDLIVKKI